MTNPPSEPGSAPIEWYIDIDDGLAYPRDVIDHENGGPRDYQVHVIEHRAVAEAYQRGLSEGALQDAKRFDDGFQADAVKWKEEALRLTRELADSADAQKYRELLKYSAQIADERDAHEAQAEKLAGAIREFDEAGTIRFKGDEKDPVWRTRWETARMGLDKALAEYERAKRGGD